MSVLWHAVKDSLLMVWQVWWALVLGFLISAIVQAWTPRERIEHSLSGSGPRPVAWATGLGAASSSCSYAAVAIAKSLFSKGASAASALAFQFASTNLVWELGVLLWVLIGWQFTLAEYLGGLVMIALMTASIRLFIPRGVERSAREHLSDLESEHEHHSTSESLTWRERVLSLRSWSGVAENFVGDWKMLWREIAIGFLLAGFVAQLGNEFFQSLFVTDAPEPWRTIENVLIGPVIAILSFVCSIGNVPLAAVLWSGGISFSGVLSFLFADLVVLPILAIYRKYYGTAFAARITTLMLCTMVLAALIVGGLFGVLGLIPHGPRPTRSAIFGSVKLDYKFVLNLLGLGIFACLFWLRARGEATSRPCPAHSS